MTRTTAPTSFARLSPLAVRIVLIVTAAATTLLVAVSLSPRAIDFRSKDVAVGKSDYDLYIAEINRVAAGENYYDAAAAELRARGYPTRSIFNWRTPLPMWLIGVLRDQWVGRLLIGGLASLVLAIALHVMARDGSIARAMFGGVLMIGGLMPAWLEDVYVMPVIWAGVLIALSVCFYANDRRNWGCALGLAAIFVRELAAPYCAVCFLLACTQRQWREVLIWLLGGAAFIAFYAWHAMQVLSRVGPGDLAHSEGWLQFGGAAFVVAVAQINGYLLQLPQWLTAIYLAAAMLGFAGWNTPTGQRAGLTVCAFVIMFAFVGQPFNQYWGSLIAPLLCFGVAQSPAALADLARRARDDTLRSPVAATA